MNLMSLVISNYDIGQGEMKTIVTSDKNHIRMGQSSGAVRVMVSNFESKEKEL